jgi:hypothetical protein
MCHFNNQTLKNPSTGDEAKSGAQKRRRRVVNAESEGHIAKLGLKIGAKRPIMSRIK